MADTYPDFETLSRHEVPGVDFGIRLRRSQAAFALMAIHGGGIEPGTSEIADAVAGETRSFYAFDGLKADRNRDLHITSTKFDEPLCLGLLPGADTVVTLHGQHSTASGQTVGLGGLDEALGALIRAGLEARGFDVRDADSGLQGRDPLNICNRGRSLKGVQLELSLSLRETLFRSLTREGRRCPTARFHELVGALGAVLDDAAAR